MTGKRDIMKKAGMILIIGAAVVSYYAVPSVRGTMNQVFQMFASGDFGVVKDFIASWGAYAAVISFLLMIFQSVAAPLPAFLLTFANANLFGWWQGAIISWTSAMEGAAV